MDDSIRFADLENPRMVKTLVVNVLLPWHKNKGCNLCVCVSTEGEKGRSMGWSALPSLGENGWSMVGLIVGAETGEIVFSWVAHKSMKLRFSPSSLHHHLSSQMIGFERFLEMISISAVRVDRRGFSRSLNPTELLVFSFDRPFLPSLLFRGMQW